MARVTFTSHLERFLSCPPAEVEGETVGALLAAIFARNPKLRSYILDDQGRLRQHVIVFVDDERLKDRVHLSDRVEKDSEVYVMQALSGG